MGANLEKIQNVLDEMSEDWFCTCNAYRTSTETIGADRETWERNLVSLASFGRSAKNPSFGDTLWALREKTKSAVKGRNKLDVDKMFNDFVSGLETTAEYFDIQTKDAFDITPPKRVCEIQGNKGSFKRPETVSFKDANFSFWTYHSYLYPEIELDDHGKHLGSSDIRMIDTKAIYAENLSKNTRVDEQITKIEEAADALRAQKVQSIADSLAANLVTSDTKENEETKSL